MSFVQTEPAGCQWLHEDYTLCGLLAGHLGDHVPFVPGEYLPPPLLHPLDAFKAAHARRCLLCGNESTPPVAEAVTAFRGEHANWDRASFEWQWRFWPCGCVVRTVPSGHDEAPAREAGA